MPGGKKIMRLGLARQVGGRALTWRALSAPGWMRRRNTRRIIAWVIRKPIQLIAVIAIAVTVTFGFWTADLSQNEEEMATHQVKIIFGLLKVPNVPLERLLSWRDMQAETGNAVIYFPDLAQQVVLSRRLTAQAGCGLDELAPLALKSVSSKGLGEQLLSTLSNRLSRLDAKFPGCNATEGLRLGAVSSVALAVPAIQDDFIGAFFTYTFGRDAAGLIALIQGGLVIGLLILSFEAASHASLHPREFEVCLFFCFINAGFGFGLALQFALSWGNTLGLFPVMGQPMSLMSLGTSHQLFFVLPAIVTTLLTDNILSAPDRGQYVGYYESRLHHGGNTDH